MDASMIIIGLCVLCYLGVVVCTWCADLEK